MGKYGKIIYKWLIFHGWNYQSVDETWYSYGGTPKTNVAWGLSNIGESQHRAIRLYTFGQGHLKPVFSGIQVVSIGSSIHQDVKGLDVPRSPAIRSCHPIMASKFCVNWMFHHIHCGKVLPVECFISYWLLKDPFLLVGKAFPAKLFVQEPLFFAQNSLWSSAFSNATNIKILCIVWKLKACCSNHTPQAPHSLGGSNRNIFTKWSTLCWQNSFFVWTMMIHPNSEASKYAFLHCLGNHDHSRQNVYRVFQDVNGKTS